MSSQSSQLHQAVDLAQSGQREQARQLLWQFIQANPNHEVAWLWLASVAADQPEYQRALNEVLRINPQNAQARRLLDEFQRQYGTPSPPGAYTPAQTPPQSPPPAAQPYGYQPPPQQLQPYSQPQGQPPAYAQPAPERIIERERVIEKRSGRGCGCLPRLSCGCGGCWQSCIVALVLLIVLPTLACGALSYGSFSLYFLDIPASVLPGKFGTKTIKFEKNDFRIEMEAPRSWYLVTDTDDMWLIWRDALDSTIVFDDPGRSWANFEEFDIPVIVDVNPVLLRINGQEIVFLQDRVITAAPNDFACETVRAQADADPAIDAVYEYHNGLCGYRMGEVVDNPSSTPVFEGVDPPAKQWRVTIFTPVDETTVLHWTFLVNEELKGMYEDRLDRLARSVKINKN